MTTVNVGILKLMLLHERIQRVLDHRHWKKGKLAAKAGIDGGGLSRIMDATTAQPVLDTLQRIARALDVTLDHLIDGEDENMPIVELIASQSLKAFLRENCHIPKSERLVLETLLSVPEDAPLSVDEWRRLVVQLQHLGYLTPI